MERCDIDVVRGHCCAKALVVACLLGFSLQALAGVPVSNTLWDVHGPEGPAWKQVQRSELPSGAQFGLDKYDKVIKYDPPKDKPDLTMADVRGKLYRRTMENGTVLYAYDTRMGYFFGTPALLLILENPKTRQYSLIYEYSPQNAFPHMEEMLLQDSKGRTRDLLCLDVNQKLQDHSTMLTRQFYQLKRGVLQGIRSVSPTFHRCFLFNVKESTPPTPRRGTLTADRTLVEATPDAMTVSVTTSTAHYKKPSQIRKYTVTYTFDSGAGAYEPPADTPEPAISVAAPYPYDKLLKYGGYYPGAGLHKYY